jgi:YihY family inner membrane protein
MSTAGVVPETRELSGEDAWATLRRARVGSVAKDAVVRLRAADGFSHARALAFQLILTLVPAAIVAVGLAVATEHSAISDAIRSSFDALLPGSAGDVFRAAFDQGQRAGAVRTGRSGLIGGGFALIVAGTTTFGQIERAANRIYGVEADRPALRKYGRGFLLACSSGVLLSGCMLSLAMGRDVGASIDDRRGHLASAIGRWPLGAVLLIAGTAMIFRLCPRRQQPSLSWLAVGGMISVAIALAVNIGLGVYLDASGSFGATYGPLAGLVGVLVWAYAGSIALLVGLAFAAQLEASRTTHDEPKDERKDEQSAPASDRPTPSAERAADDRRPVASGLRSG